MNNKTITFLIQFLGAGGAERVGITLTNYFIERGYKVNLIIMNDKIKDYIPNKKVNIIFLHDKEKCIKIINRFIKIKQLTKILRSLQTDTIILFDGNIWSNFCCKIVCSNKVKVIVSERNDPENSPPGFIRKKIRDFIYNYADKLVFQTEDAKTYFSLQIQQRGIVIPNPIKEDLPDPVIGQRNMEIVNFCRLESQKNLIMLLDAFKIFVEEYRNFKLKIYGRGNLEMKLRKYIKDIGLSDKAFIEDFEKNIHEKIKDSAIFVSSSDYEGISNSMLEALALGIPTICTDCPSGGARMFIKPYENGLLVPVGNATALYKAMKEIIDSPDLSGKISNNAVKIRQELAINKIGSKWERIL